MDTTVSFCHRFARGTSILEVLVSLVLFATAISGTLHIYALAVDATKQSFEVTSTALQSGSRSERQLQYAGRIEESGPVGKGEAP